MRGTKAKALRRRIYGNDMSHRVREYLPGHEPRQGSVFEQVRHMMGARRYAGNPTCICTGLRRKYQDLKKAVA